MKNKLILLLLLSFLIIGTASCEKITIFEGTAERLSIRDNVPLIGLHNGTLWQYFTVDEKQYGEIVLGEEYRFTEIQWPNGKKNTYYKVVI